MDTQCFGTGDSHVEALIQIILFWYRFVDFSLYKYWKIVSCLWLYRGQCCWCIGWNRPKKGLLFISHFYDFELSWVVDFLGLAPESWCSLMEKRILVTRWKDKQQKLGTSPYLDVCLPASHLPPRPPRRPHVRWPPPGCHACGSLKSPPPPWLIVVATCPPKFIHFHASECLSTL